MRSSESISKIALALVKAQGELNAVHKDAKNPHFRAGYATLQNIVESTRDVLRKHNLAVVQTFEHTDGTYVNLVTTLLHESGEYITSTLTMRPTKSDPQGLGSATTYARRYAFSAILGIVTDDDDDGNASSQPVIDRAPQAKYRSEPAGAELPWLNAVGKDGKFTATGNKIIQRFLDDPTMTWDKVSQHYKVSKDDKKAIDDALIAEVKMVASVLDAEVQP
jgi:hypothetical protein